jgi:hypothetical protein
MENIEVPSCGNLDIPLFIFVGLKIKKFIGIGKKEIDLMDF